MPLRPPRSSVVEHRARNSSLRRLRGLHHSPKVTGPNPVAGGDAQNELDPFSAVWVGRDLTLRLANEVGSGGSERIQLE